MPKSMRRDQTASSQPFAFLVAGAIFLSAIGGLLVVTRGAAVDHKSPDRALQGVEANGLADMLVTSPGVGWAAGPDHLSRLGLAAANGSGLDPASLDALRGAVATSTANGKVDYDEARASLGLSSGDGFHIRVYPIGLDELYGESIAGLRVGYIGDWTSLASVSIPSTTAPAQMPAEANAKLNLSMFANSYQERAALRALGVQFNDRVYITAATPTILVDYPSPLPDLPVLTVLHLSLLEGDVYPDSKPYLDQVLASRLSRYDVLVIGSGVDHGTLVKEANKNGIRDWVLAGGTLVVFGSDDKSTGWLNPLFHSGVDNVNGAPTAPDATHPLLRIPNELAWTSYDSHGQAWDLSSGEDDVYGDFSHVVIQGGGDVMAVSHEASFGAGRIVLTTYRARDVAVSLGQVEVQHLFENLLGYADRSSFYLDYGGTVPADRPVALAVRESFLHDAVLGEVPIRIEVLTWG